MKAVLAAIGMLLAATVRADDPVLSFPSGAGTARLKLNVTVEGQSPDSNWNTFLDSLFDYFDRNGDGSLSSAEAARVIALPLSKDRTVALNFAKLDSNRDDRASREEFLAYYRSAGFAAVVVAIQPAPIEILSLGDSLFVRLDRDGDSAISVEEWKAASKLMRRFDENEDELLSAAELMTTIRPQPPSFGGLRLPKSGEKQSPQGTLRLPLGGKPSLVETPKFAFDAGGSRLTVPGGSCAVGASADNTGFRASKGFYLAQFKSAGEGPHAKAAFEDDPTARVLANLFDPADRDGDGKLSLAELETFFALIERGANARVLVTVEDRGRNLFDLVDANGDGRLDLRELNRAAGSKPLDRNGVPASYRLAVRRGTAGDAFGPVPLGSIAKPAAATKSTNSGPRWFRSMDRNGDGFVSAAEFPGTPARLQKLDRNADGQISEAEATAGEK